MSFLGAAARDLLSQATIVDLLRVDSARRSLQRTVHTRRPARLGRSDQVRVSRHQTDSCQRFEIGRRPHHAHQQRRHSRPRRALRAVAARLEASAIAAADKATGGAWSRMMAYQTDEARAVLAASAAAAGDQAAADRWSKGHQPTINTTVDTPEQAPVSTPATDATETLPDSSRNTVLRRGRKLKAGWRSSRCAPSIGDQEHMLTKDLIDRLASADAPRWGDLTPRALATLVSHHGVDPVPIRAENNARGYTRAAVEAAFDM